MKNISTGFGLALLAGAILAFPIISSLAPSANASATSSSSLAPTLDAGRQSHSREDVTLGATESRRIDGPGVGRGERHAGFVNQASGDACAQPIVQWFSPEPKRLLQCDGSRFIIAEVTVGPGNADVNSDGVAESFEGGQAEIIAGGISVEQASAVIRRNLPPSTSGQVSRMRREVVLQVGGNLAPFVRSLYPDSAIYRANIAPLTWRDCDGDGDQDLICWLRTQGCASIDCSLPDEALWFENVGYERTQPPLAADLNRDGRVDGADLGLVLVAWGATP
jgi:hypothetical protein